jgi:hypothetical protein
VSGTIKTKDNQNYLIKIFFNKLSNSNRMGQDGGGQQPGDQLAPQRRLPGGRSTGKRPGPVGPLTCVYQAGGVAQVQSDSILCAVLYSCN